jgi:hypothetical protein
MLEPDLASIPLAASPERSLESLLLGTDARFIAVHLPYLCVDAVVLDQQDRDVTLLLDGNTAATTLFGTAIAQRIEDPVREAALVRQALAHEREQVVASRIRLDGFGRYHARMLDRIRDYAIRQHRVGRIGRDAVIRFLRTFDLPPLEPQSRVAFTITGEYLVDSDDLNQVQDDGTEHLAADFGRLDAFVAGSGSYTVTIDGIAAAE